jgi:hypothetical protein
MAMGLRKKLLMGLVMILSGATYSSAAYMAGQEWDFADMFSTGSNLGQQDSEGNTVWEYRYINWDGGPTSGGLMGSFHSWETPPTWQKDGGANNGRLAPNYFQSNSGGDQCVALTWVAPTDGVVNVSIVLTGREGNGAGFTIWPGQESTVTVNEVYSTDWSWSVENLAVSAGDKIMLKMIPWGAGTVRFTGADMTVTLMTPEPATMGLLAVGGLGVLFRRKR